MLYVSGYSEDDMSEHGILDADLEFLEKPFTPQALSRKVREVLYPFEFRLAQDGDRRGEAEMLAGLDNSATPE